MSEWCNTAEFLVAVKNIRRIRSILVDNRKQETSWLPSKKETNTFGSKILKNLGLKKSGHLEIRG